MTATIETLTTEPAPAPEPEPEQVPPAAEAPRIGCRRCAEVRHGGPSCN